MFMCNVRGSARPAQALSGRMSDNIVQRQLRRLQSPPQQQAVSFNDAGVSVEDSEERVAGATANPDDASPAASAAVRGLREDR
jgi:hypothetical protein